MWCFEASPELESHGSRPRPPSWSRVTATGVTAAGQHKVDSKWFRATEPIASACLYLALVALVRGDPTTAEAELAMAARRAEGFGFPEGPYMRAYTRSMETWLRIEAGQLDHAAVLAAEMINDAERYGFDMWRLVGATWQSAVGELAALDADPAAVGAHVATFATLLEEAAHAGREHLHHRLRRRRRTGADRRRSTRGGPRMPGHRLTAGP